VNGEFVPCEKGIGVVYTLEVEHVPPESLHEIGIQPLPRPFAQRGFLLKVPPEVNLLVHPAVWPIYFQHSDAASMAIGELFDSGVSLVPKDHVSTHLEARLRERFVTRVGMNAYLDRVPLHHRHTLETNIEALFLGTIPIKQ
jgi:hypothetical protein